MGKRNQWKKVLSSLLVLVLTLSMVAGTSGVAKAEEGGATTQVSKLKFSASDLENCDITYQIGKGENVSVDSLTADENGAIWVDNIENNSSITITATIKAGVKKDIDRLTACEGESAEAGPAYNGSETNVNDTYTFTFTSDATKVEVYAVKLEYKNTSEPDNPSQQETQTTIKVGDTVLYENGQATNTISGITISQQNGFPCIELTGCNQSDKDLMILGNNHVGLIVSNGTNSFNSIILGAGAKIDGDGGDKAKLVLKQGVKKASGASNPADSFVLKNDVILEIGTLGSPATTAFDGINNVELYNYDFHSRDSINTIIYATTAFNNVTDVFVLASKAQVNATTIFTKSEGTTNCTVCQEGQIQLIGAIGKGKLFSKYYKEYPSDTSAQYQTDRYGMLESEKYVASTEITNGSNNETTNHCEVTGSGDDITLKSTDSILYSVSYQVDPNIEEDSKNFPNPHAGAVTMNGFEKGFYIQDGTGGKFEAWIAAGETVNVTILPKPGYQYQKNTLNINGEIIKNVAPSDTRGQYSFIMPPNAGHICAGFAKTEDIVDVNATGIASADIANTQSVVTNGNAKLEIANTSSEDKNKETFESVANSNTPDSEATDAEKFEVKSFLDVNVSEAVVKNYDPHATTQSSWDTKKTDFDKPVQISIKVNGALSGAEEYKIIRKHNDKIEAIDTTYDASTNTITFDSNRFSVYAVCAKGTAPAKPSGPSITPSDPSDPETPQEPDAPAKEETTTETKTDEDGTVTETTTVKKPDGSESVTEKVTKPDGTVTESEKVTTADGATKETEKVSTKDGTVTEKETVTSPSGAVKSEETITKADGSKEEIKTQVSADGKKETSTEVSYDATGKIVHAEVSVAQMTTSKSVSVSVSELRESVKSVGGDATVTITSKTASGAVRFEASVDSDALKKNTELKVYAVDKKGNIVILDPKKKNAATIKNGKLTVNTSEKGELKLVTPSEAKKVEKKILASVKPEKKSQTVNKGKSLKFTFADGFSTKNIKKIKYEASDSDIKVSKSGKITAKAKGTATVKVTVTLKNGKTKTIKMKIKIK